MITYAFSKTDVWRLWKTLFSITRTINHSSYLAAIRFCLIEGRTDKTCYETSERYIFWTWRLQLYEKKSCAAGRRRYCEHIAALCNKLVEAKMVSGKELPKYLTVAETNIDCERICCLNDAL